MEMKRSVRLTTLAKIYASTLWSRIRLAAKVNPCRRLSSSMKSTSASKARVRLQDYPASLLGLPPAIYAAPTVTPLMPSLRAVNGHFPRYAPRFFDFRSPTFKRNVP